MLPALIGMKRVADALLNNRTISAEEAVNWGLASRMVEAAEMDAEAVKIARNMCGMKASAMRSSKGLLNDLYDDLAARLDEERARFVVQIQQAEALSGMQAFLEGGKRGAK